MAKRVTETREKPTVKNRTVTIEEPVVVNEEEEITKVVCPVCDLEYEEAVLLRATYKGTSVIGDINPDVESAACKGCAVNTLGFNPRKLRTVPAEDLPDADYPELNECPETNVTMLFTSIATGLLLGVVAPPTGHLLTPLSLIVALAGTVVLGFMWSAYLIHEEKKLAQV